METHHLLPFLWLDPQEMPKIKAAMHQSVSVTETETKPPLSTFTFSSFLYSFIVFSVLPFSLLLPILSFPPSISPTHFPWLSPSFTSFLPSVPCPHLLCPSLLPQSLSLKTWVLSCREMLKKLKAFIVSLWFHSSVLGLRVFVSEGEWSWQ